MTKDFTISTTNEQTSFKVANKKDTIYLKDANEVDTESFRVEGDKLVFTADGQEYSFSNYKNVKYVKTVDAGGNVSLLDLIGGGFVDNTNAIAYNKKTLKAKGTNYNDVLDFSESGYVAKGKSKKGLTINGGKGNDEITGTEYNDTLVGGIGRNTINYSGGNDVINLTKGENLTINFSDFAEDEVSYNIVKNDLRIYTAQDEYVTLKNFVKNVTNNSKKGKEDTSSVEVIFSDNTVDLRTEAVYDTKVSKNYNGTWLNDKIDASETTLYKKVGKKKVEKEETDIGLTLKGGKGNDEVIGTDYSDKLYGGVGNDTLNGGLGNNLLYFNKGDGHDTVENGGGTDTLVFAKGTELSYEYDDTDLVVTYGNDSVTLEDFANGHSVKYVKVGKTLSKINPPEYVQPDNLLSNSVAPIDDTEPAETHVDNLEQNEQVVNVVEKPTPIVIEDANTVSLGPDDTSVVINGIVDKSVTTGVGNDSITVNTLGYVPKVYAGQGSDEVIIKGYVGDVYCDTNRFNNKSDDGADTVTLENTGEVYEIYGCGGDDTFNIYGKYHRIDGGDGYDTFNIYGQTVGYSMAPGTIYGENVTVHEGGTVGTIWGSIDRETMEHLTLDTNINIKGVADYIGCGSGKDIINVSGTIRYIQTTNGDDEITISGTVTGGVASCGGNNTITTTETADVAAIEFYSNKVGHDTLYLNATRDNLVFANDDLTYAWDGNDLVISNFKGRHTATIKNFDANNTSVYVNGTLLSELVEQVTAFSTDSSDMSLNYNDLGGTDNVNAVIAEYMPNPSQF